MSVDWKVEKTCDHRVVAERHSFEADQKTIRFAKPITSSQVILRINGVKVPSGHPRFSFTLQNDELSKPPDLRRKLVIVGVARSLDDLIEITYQTSANSCPKCLGVGIHDDPEFDALGRPIIFGEIIKLTQELRKGTKTALQSNPFHSWIGTRIVERIGTKVSDVGVVRLAIMDEVTRFVTNYQNVQKKQIEVGQTVDPGEIFLRLLEIRVVPADPNIPLVFNVTVRFQSASGELGDVKLQLALPAGALFDQGTFDQVKA